jgi:hypothetical protein
VEEEKEEEKKKKANFFYSTHLPFNKQVIRTISNHKSLTLPFLNAS